MSVKLVNILHVLLVSVMFRLVSVDVYYYRLLN